MQRTIHSSSQAPYITLFGSSQPKAGEEEYEKAYRIGYALAKAGFRILNGGYSGTMEASAKGAKDAGGSATGVLVRDLNYALPNIYLEHQMMANHLFERIQLMMDQGSGFVVLKGGTGTLLELAAVWEFVNKAFLHEKPIILADPFWNPLIEIMMHEKSLGDFYTKDGAIHPSTRYLTRIDAPEEIALSLSNMLFGTKQD